jgi:hypothetical protein
MKDNQEVRGVKNEKKTQKERNKIYLKDLKQMAFEEETQYLNDELFYKGFNESVIGRGLNGLNGRGILVKNRVFKFVGSLINGKKIGFGQIMMKKLYKYRGMFENDLKSGKGDYLDYTNGLLIKGVWKDDFIQAFRKINGFQFVCIAQNIEKEIFGFVFQKNVKEYYIGFLDFEFNRQGFGFLVNEKDKQFRFFERKTQEKQQDPEIIENSFDLIDIQNFIHKFFTFFQESNLEKFKKYYLKYFNSLSSKKSQDFKATLNVKQFWKIAKILYSFINFFMKLNSDHLIIGDDLKEDYFDNLFNDFWTLMPEKYKYFSNTSEKTSEFLKSEKPSVSISNSSLINKTSSNFSAFFKNTDTLKINSKDYYGISTGTYKFNSKKDEKGNSQVYKGQFLNGKPHGLGTMYYQNNSIYEGEWKEGEKYGIGIYHVSGETFYLETSENQEIPKIFNLIK